MSIFTNFSKVFHHLTDDGKALVGDDLKAAWDFLSPLAHDILRNGGQVLITAATEAVVAAQAAGGTPDEKFNFARKAVENNLKATIPVIETNVLDGVLKAAVAKLHAAQPDPTAIPPEETTAALSNN